MRRGESAWPLIIALALMAYAFGWIGGEGGIIPTPTPDAPIPVEGLHVMIIEESGERRNLTPDKVAIFTSIKLRKWLDDNDAEWRIIDASGNDISNDEQKWQDAFNRPRPELPWLIVSNHPNGGAEVPLPDTVDQTIRKLEEFK